MIGVLPQQVKQEPLRTVLEMHSRAPDAEQLEEAGHLIIVRPEGESAPWPALPHLETVKRRLQGPGPALAQLPDVRGTWISLFTLGEGQSTFQRLTAARKAVAPHLERRAESLRIAFADLPRETALAAADALVSALLCGAHALPRFGKTPPPEPRPLTLHLHGLSAFPDDLAWSAATAEGTNLARDLVALPGNELSPKGLRERVESLARAEGWEMTFYHRQRLREMGAGAFLAVLSASLEEGAGIVHLRYRPEGTDARPVALVGKGVCFDTGGVNLKGARHMFGMHADMAGAAVVLGTLLALTRLKHPYPVDAWLAVADNLIGPEAYRPNEVVRALDGTTVEIVHTDAEGRLLLADTLALAARERPAALIDLATLTGTCVQALGDRYCGAFSNDPELAERTRRGGEETGERAWPFPMDPDYDEALESDVADIKQCTLDTAADHILAARFLSRFVPDGLPWLHLDLAPATRKGGLAHVPTEATGFGVRLTTRLVIETSKY